MLMSRHNIRHLPVKNNDQIVGLISATDLIQRQSASPVYLVADVYRQSSVEQLAEVSNLIPQVLVNLVDADATAHSIGYMISSIGDAITVQLLQLAQEQLGPAPVSYCWLSFGSLARMDQTARSDQDNGLLLADSYDAKLHGDYFKKLARFVNDGLNACGYEYCPGEIMAINDKWRQPLSAWKKYFFNWINKPEPKALMHASIFFDMRRIHGDNELFVELHRHVLQQSEANRIFLAHLTANALHLEPPLGFFRRFVLVHDGEHNNTLDLKHNGVVPIIDLARIYALAGSIDAINTRSRLEAAAGCGEVSSQGAEDLRDALELISMTRLRHQARLIRAGKQANNFIPPDELSNFERNHLKEAFEIVRTMQAALGQRYQTGRSLRDIAMFERFLSANQRRKKLLSLAPEGALRDYLEHPFVDVNSRLEDVDFLALDLEATGLDFDRDEILSVGFTVIHQMTIMLAESQYFLVRPEQAIPEKTAIVHGIMDDASAGGIELKQALEYVLQALRGRVLLAHHTNIECNFLNRACQKVYGCDVVFPIVDTYQKVYGCDVVFPIVDTYAIEYNSLKHRGITPENKGLRLYKLREDYGLPRYPAHNALSDAVAAAELFLAQIAHRQGRASMRLKQIIARC